MAKQTSRQLVLDRRQALSQGGKMPLLKAQHLIEFVPQAMREPRELMRLLLSLKKLWLIQIILLLS